MTRVDLYEEMREIKFQKANVIATEDCQYLIDKVFNYFENKNCINCKYFELKTEERKFDIELVGYCKNKKLWEGMYKRIVVDDFGCNSFEEKGAEK